MISFGGATRFGGAGWILPGDVSVDGNRSTDLRLQMGYGGLVVRRVLAHEGATRIGGRILIGAGTAHIALPVVGSRIASDNFFVLEPEITAQVRVMRWLGVGLGTSFRYVDGVEDLPGVRRSDLAGFALAFRVSAGPF